MLLSQKATALLCLLSFLGIGGLYLLASYTMVPVVHLDELEKYENEIVRVRASVTDVEYLDFDAAKVYIREGNTTSLVFIETLRQDDLEITKGDEVEVTGKVQLYKGEFEIVVENERNIKIVKRAENKILFLSTLSRNSWKYRDLNVKIFAKLKYNITYYRFEDENGEGEETKWVELIHLFLTDEEGFYSVKARIYKEKVNETLWQCALSLCEKDSVLIGGTLKYSYKEMRYVIEVEGEGALLQKSEDLED